MKELSQDAQLWKNFALALNVEDIDQDRVIKAYNALCEAGLIETCERCDGSGKKTTVTSLYMDGTYDVHVSPMMPCLYCNGTGKNP